jgi:hypothetical protein
VITALERVAIVVAALALAIGVIALLSGSLFTGSDKAAVNNAVAGPGIAVRDLGHASLPVHHPHIAYDSNPPTSGPHAPEIVRRDGALLDSDQVLQALQAGDVVLMYGTPRAPVRLRALAHALAPPFSPALAASGQAVILARRPGVTGVIGLAWAHLILVSAPNDPRLRAFANFWLGRGASG